MPDLRSGEDAGFVAQEAVGAKIAAALATRLGRGPRDLEVGALVGAALAALDAASCRWARSDGSDDLIELIDEAFRALANPFPELRA